jgi:recombinational DNA repair protein (RecF pathway)
MSNRVKLKGSRPPLPRCAACGRPIPKSMYRAEMSSGDLVCTRCADLGVMMQRLACGHMGIPKMTVFMDGCDNRFTCPRCSSHSAELMDSYRNQRLSGGR